MDSDPNFSVNVRSVDGFQGGEEDIVMISTLSSNKKGNLRFLSNRHSKCGSRHCLWLLGNAETLEQSSSVWRKILNDAKQRECFHNADDQNLAQAIKDALLLLELVDESKSQFKSLSITDKTEKSRTDSSKFQKEGCNTVRLFV